MPAPETPDLASMMTSAPVTSSPGLDQRRQRQQGRRRVAARIGHEPRRRHGRALELGQAVCDAVRRNAVRFGVPPGTRGLIAQAECAGQIDDAEALVDQRRRELGSRRVRQRQEHDVGLALERFGLEGRDGAVPEVRKRR